MKKVIIFWTLLVTSLAFAEGKLVNPTDEFQRFQQAVTKTKELARDQFTQDLAKKYGLDVLSFAWEDTARQKNSSLGPNITDMSIQVHSVNAKGNKTAVLMPIFRFPNFDDKIAELSPNDFNLLVGNEKGEGLKKITLTQYLSDFRKYLTKPEAWRGGETSLMLPRDTSVIVSAQHSLLPVPKGQEVSFNPVVFNYQSSENNAAILTILATREGTSATIINNTRDGFETAATSGQRLFYNVNGERASLTATRISDFMQSDEGQAIVANGENQTLNANNNSGMNMVLIIQVPLVNKPSSIFGFGGPMLELAMASPVMMTDVEEAVIGHGVLEGLFTEIDETNTLDEDQQIIKRDSRFPIRVTVQFYHATENAVLDEALMKKMRSQINSVYKNADFVGSLVSEGETGSVLEHDVECDFTKTWIPFWNRYYPNYLERQAENLLTPVIEMQGGTLNEFVVPAMFMPLVWGNYWTYFCRDEVQLEKAMDYLLGYEAPEEEISEQE